MLILTSNLMIYSNASAKTNLNPITAHPKFSLKNETKKITKKYSFSLSLFHTKNYLGNLIVASNLIIFSLTQKSRGFGFSCALFFLQRNLMQLVAATCAIIDHLLDPSARF